MKNSIRSFKPYYKWITFNTKKLIDTDLSILGFKPYYKWITFNTMEVFKMRVYEKMNEF